MFIAEQRVPWQRGGGAGTPLFPFARRRRVWTPVLCRLPRVFVMHSEPDHLPDQQDKCLAWDKEESRFVGTPPTHMQTQVISGAN